ncbi:hypothetical protein N4Q45_01560, partial [Bacillus licheniformis]|uniref:hypothetical protein n=4 Tax=Bacillus TaxID=1386 RepID=UPI002E3769F9
LPSGFSVSTNPRIRCQACASVLTNSNIRSAPMLGLPRLQGFSITLKGMTKSQNKKSFWDLSTI